MAESLHISTYPKLSSVNCHHTTPIVLIHGWGLNSAVWQPWIDNLPAAFFDVFHIITLDLPGFGINKDKKISPYSLQNICQFISDTITQPAIYVGWSLGGVIATEMTLSFPDKVLALITVASSPRFIEQAGDNNEQDVWPGIKPKVLNSFHQQLKFDTKKTISGFLKIQAMGSPHIRHDIKVISQLVFQHEMASKVTLDQSLRLLETSDHRTRLSAIKQPFLRLYGEADSLVPKTVIAQIAKLAQNSEQFVFKQASHAPFISHADDFSKILCNWLLTKAEGNFS